MIKVIFNMLVKNIKTCNQMVWLTFFKVITELIFYQKKKKNELIYIYIDKSIFYIEESSLFIMYHASGKKKKAAHSFPKRKKQKPKIRAFWVLACR